jgi:hypothetical protein
MLLLGAHAILARLRLQGLYDFVLDISHNEIRHHSPSELPGMK